MASETPASVAGDDDQDEGEEDPVAKYVMTVEEPLPSSQAGLKTAEKMSIAERGRSPSAS